MSIAYSDRVVCVRVMSPTIVRRTRNIYNYIRRKVK